MGMTSIWHWLILLVVLLLLFGAGKIPKLMGDMASGIKAFKKGMKDADGENVGKGLPTASLPKQSRKKSGPWRFVGAAVGGLLGAVILGAASFPIFGILAVPGLIFGIHYGGMVGRGFDYIEPEP
jgi:sec-independent protein translocase protein TatA